VVHAGAHGVLEPASALVVLAGAHGVLEPASALVVLAGAHGVLEPASALVVHAGAHGVLEPASALVVLAGAHGVLEPASALVVLAGVYYKHIYTEYHATAGTSYTLVSKLLQGHTTCLSPSPSILRFSRAQCRPLFTSCTSWTNNSFVRTTA